MLNRLYFKEIKEQGLLDAIKRDTGSFPEQEKIVKEILADVRENKDKALFSYIKKFDGIDIDASNIEVTEAEIDEAMEKIDKDLLKTIELSAKNVRDYHEKVKILPMDDNSNPGVYLGQRVIPINRVGLYVPGGKASYPSTVLMDAIPASVAGVKEIIMTTPCGKDGKVNPAIIASGKIAGVTKILKIGGAQAIAALAYGTESVAKVDKIVGPGNIFVALAKRQVFGDVGLDSVAGPTEITILCDNTANPKFIAADLLSQAEHDEMAQSIVVTVDESIVGLVDAEINKQIDELSRTSIMESSIKNHGFAVICDSIEDAINAVNAIAPEHLEVQTKNPEELLPMIKNAGAVFLGDYSSEPLGDYYAGPSHVLPTNGTARFFSPLSTADFVKRQSVISYSKEALVKASEHVIRFAMSEGLDAHANSIKVRL